jgi:pimeloyl-ACP methyl ester carboxylesterase
MRPWPALAPFSRSVRLASGINLFVYDTAEDKPPVVLLHGLGDDADTWRHVAGPLSAASRVIAPDLPGFGRSDKPAVAYDVPFFLACLIEVIERLGASGGSGAGQGVTVIGNSLGAMLAQSLALEHPTLVARLALVDGLLVARGQRPSLASLAFLVPGLGEALYNRLRRNPQSAYGTLRPYYADLGALPEADRGFLFQRVNERVWSDGQRRAYLSVVRRLFAWLAGRQRRFAAALAELRTPTLVVWGEQDRIMPVANAHAYRAIQPAARVAVIPGAGHLPQQEKPVLFLEALEQS